MTTTPERSKDPIVVSSLFAAYQEMQQKGLAVVPSSLTSHAKESYKMTVPLGGKETTWDLVKVAKKGKSSCIKDGINDDRKSMDNPESVVKKVTETAPRLVNSNKTKKRRKKRTASNVLQLQNSGLFCVERNRAKVKEGADDDDPEEIAEWWSMIEGKEKKKQKKREKKRKSKMTGEKKRQKIREEPKKGKKRYSHLQEFIETRRQKKVQRKRTLDLSAQVAV